ncbi:MAG: DUF3244 domain-containing protein [Dysgonamonadaceae bacterium]|nr:DUF3244 domain-containing protein [Dysgonamonadaceae bacterium]MDD4378978.1 DUF3244 domain-containing protein [Dysgonamonadaceae bacterium]
MKRNFILAAFSIIVVSGLYSFVILDGRSMASTNHKIELEKRTGGTRSATAAIVNAFVDDSFLTIEIENYSGIAWVEVTGQGGSVQQSFQIDNSGACMFDISILPAGSYALCIMLENGTYDGLLEK